jgi:hypothetical protein
MKQTPQPNGAWIRRAMVDEVSQTTLSQLPDVDAASECSIPHPILLLVVLKASRLCVFCRRLLRLILTCLLSGARPIRDFLFVPCPYFHPYDPDASILTIGCSCDRWRPAHPPSPCEETAGLG